MLESAAMHIRRCACVLAAVSAGSSLLLALGAHVAEAQTKIDPTVQPAKDPAGTGPITPFGIQTSLAAIIGLLGVIVVVVMVILYLRYAPRFAKDEGSLKVVRADRVRLGQELPRRNVDLTQAAPVLVAPPPIPGAQASALVAAPAAAAPALAAPAPEASAPAAEAEAPAPAATAPPAPAPAPAERVEVTLDQEVFDKTLEELLAAGTDRRIAEGKARRAGMIAAKKKAAGEG